MAHECSPWPVSVLAGFIHKVLVLLTRHAEDVLDPFALQAFDKQVGYFHDSASTVITAWWVKPKKASWTGMMPVNTTTSRAS